MPHEKNSGNNAIFPHVLAASFSTVIAHPLRVCLNRAAYHNSIRGVLADLPTYWRTGLGLNLMRGVGVVSLQSWSNQTVQSHFSQSCIKSKVAGWFAATLSGTLAATTVETIFIRKTIAQGSSFNLPLTRFTPHLAAAFFLREGCFNVAVICANDIPSTAYYPTLVLATGVSAMCHKIATWEATADLAHAAKQGSVPHFSRDGITKTVRNIAQGNVYTHSSCKAPISKPATNLQFLQNFMSVACGNHMFFFRFAYLAAFKFLYSQSLKYAPLAQSKMNFWNNKEPLALKQSPALTIEGPSNKI